MTDEKVCREIRAMSVRDNWIEFLAGRYGLPVFVCMPIWTTAQFVASGGQPDALLATDRHNANGFDIALVQRLLQHSSATTTQRYIGIEPQKIEQAIQNHANLI